VVLPAIHLQTPRVPLPAGESTHCCPRITGLISPQFPRSSLSHFFPPPAPILPRPRSVLLERARCSSARITRASTPMRVRACARSHKIIYTTRREAGCSNYESRRERALIQKIAAYFRPIILRTGSPCPSSSVRAFRHGHRWPPDESLNSLPPSPLSLSPRPRASGV